MSELKMLESVKVESVAIVKTDGFDLVLQELRERLKPYENIHVTVETLKGDKKILADMNKIKKAKDTKRKAIKKDLDKAYLPIKEKSDAIDALIDGYYNPIKEQIDEFEIKRKEQKEFDVKIAIDKCKEETTVRVEYLDRIELKKEYLNATMSINKVTEDIKKQIELLAVEQQTFDNKVDTVKMFIEMKNETLKLEVPLEYDNFTHLINLDIIDLKNKVTELGERRMKQEREAAERIRLEAERKAKAEADRIIAEEKAKQQAELDRIEVEKQAEIDKRVAEETKEVVEQAEEKMVRAENITKVVNKFMPVDSSPSIDTFARCYELKATAEQFKALDKYLDASGIEVE